MGTRAFIALWCCLALIAATTAAGPEAVHPQPASSDNNTFTAILPAGSSDPRRLSALLPPAVFNRTAELAELSDGYACLCDLGDLDGDGGTVELACGDIYARAVKIVSVLPATGQVTKEVVHLGNGLGGVPLGSFGKYFGSSIKFLGDLDGDGAAGELAVGAEADNDDNTGGLYILWLGLPGLRARKFSHISDGVGGLPTGTLPEGARCGLEVAGLLDVDGDGTEREAVLGCQGDTVVVLWLSQSTGEATSFVKLQDGINGIPSGYVASTRFGQCLAGLGDLNGDGRSAEVLVGAGAAESYTGRAFVLFLSATGAASRVTRIGNGFGGLPSGTIASSTQFGVGVAALGDIDGDGHAGEVAVGAFADDTGATNAGAVYLIWLRATDGAATAYVKLANGLGGMPSGALPSAALFGYRITPLAYPSGEARGAAGFVTDFGQHRRLVMFNTPSLLQVADKPAVVWRNSSAHGTTTVTIPGQPHAWSWLPTISVGGQACSAMVALADGSISCTVAVDIMAEVSATVSDRQLTGATWTLAGHPAMQGRSQDCDAGTFWDRKAQQCQLCPVGSYRARSDPVRDKCVPCGRGQGAPMGSTSANACRECPPGQYPQQGSCTDCPAGRFASRAGMRRCDLCPPGRYQPSTGQTSCTACAAGTYYQHFGGSAASVCKACSGAAPGSGSCPVGTATCPSTWHGYSATDQGWLGRCYKASSSSSGSVRLAMEACQGLSQTANLAVFTTAAEYDGAVAAAAAVTGTYYAVGLTSQDTSAPGDSPSGLSPWWKTMCEVTQVLSSRGSYEPVGLNCDASSEFMRSTWRLGEPNNDNYGEQCVELSAQTSNLYDIQCGYRKGTPGGDVTSGVRFPLCSDKRVTLLSGRVTLQSRLTVPIARWFLQVPAVDDPDSRPAIGLRFLRFTNKEELSTYRNSNLQPTLDISYGTGGSGLSWNESGIKSEPIIPSSLDFGKLRVVPAMAAIVKAQHPGSVAVSETGAEYYFEAEAMLLYRTKPGFYTNSTYTGPSWPMPCPRGRFAAEYGYRDECEPCPAGRYCPYGGQPSCRRCPVGRFSSAGATNCEPSARPASCPDGWFALDNRSDGVPWDGRCYWHIPARESSTGPVLGDAGPRRASVMCSRLHPGATLAVVPDATAGALLADKFRYPYHWTTSLPTASAYVGAYADCDMDSKSSWSMRDTNTAWDTVAERRAGGCWKYPTEAGGLSHTPARTEAMLAGWWGDTEPSVTATDAEKRWTRMVLSAEDSSTSYMEATNEQVLASENGALCSLRRPTFPPVDGSWATISNAPWGAASNQSALWFFLSTNADGRKLEVQLMKRPPSSSVKLEVYDGEWARSWPSSGTTHTVATPVLSSTSAALQSSVYSSGRHMTVAITGANLEAESVVELRVREFVAPTACPEGWSKPAVTTMSEGVSDWEGRCYRAPFYEFASGYGDAKDRCALEYEGATLAVWATQAEYDAIHDADWGLAASPTSYFALTDLQPGCTWSKYASTFTTVADRAASGCWEFASAERGGYRMSRAEVELSTKGRWYSGNLPSDLGTGTTGVVVVGSSLDKALMPSFKPHRHESATAGSDFARVCSVRNAQITDPLGAPSRFGTKFTGSSAETYTWFLSASKPGHVLEITFLSNWAGHSRVFDGAAHMQWMADSNQTTTNPGGYRRVLREPLLHSVAGTHKTGTVVRTTTRHAVVAVGVAAASTSMAGVWMQVREVRLCRPGQQPSPDNAKCLRVAKDRSRSVPQPYAKTIAHVSPNTCVVRSNGTAVCWGSDSSATDLRGHSVNAEWHTPSQMPPVGVSPTNEPVKEVSLGSQVACSLLVGGKVKCWGSNSYGRLGISTLTTSEAYSPSHGHGYVPVGAKAIQVSVSSRHACVRTEKLTVRCWGSGDRTGYGFPGKPARSASPIIGNLARYPELMADLPFGEPAASVQTSYDGGCILTHSGGVRCWGLSTQGITGDGLKEVVHPSGAARVVRAVDGTYTWTSSTAPVRAPHNPTGHVDVGGAVERLFGGPDAMCVVMRETGGLRCWGYDYNGFLLQRTESDFVFGDDIGETPAATGDMPFLPSNHTHGRVMHVGVGKELLCAAMEDGAVVCWGEHATLGCNRPRHLYTIRSKMAVKACLYRFESEAVAVEAGTTGACALLRSGAVRCWGSINYDGRLGYGDVDVRRDANDDTTSDIDLGERMLVKMPFA